MVPQFGNVVNSLAKAFNVSSYLELGLDRCVTIQMVKESIPDCYCFGVDLMVSVKDGNFDYYEGTTDSFFEQNTKTFDLIFDNVSQCLVDSWDKNTHQNLQN